MTAAQQRKLAPLVVLGGHHQTFLATKIAGAALNSWKDDPGHPWNFENKWPYMAQLAFQRQVFYTILGCQCAKENTFIMLSLIASLVLLWLRCRQGKMRPALPCGHPVGHPLKPEKENKYNRMDTNTLPWKPHGPPPQILCDHHGLACCQTCDPSPCWEADCTAGQLTCSWKTWARGSSSHTCHQAEAPICKSDPNSMLRPWMWLSKGGEEACDALPRRASLRANTTWPHKNYLWPWLIEAGTVPRRPRGIPGQSARGSKARDNVRIFKTAKQQPKIDFRLSLDGQNLENNLSLLNLTLSPRSDGSHLWSITCA